MLRAVFVLFFAFFHEMYCMFKKYVYLCTRNRIGRMPDSDC